MRRPRIPAGTARFAAAAVSGLAWILSAAVSHSLEGPLAVKNSFPLVSVLDAPYPEQAGYRDSLSIGLTHSSVDFIESDGGFEFLIDAEVTELEFRYKKTVSGSFEFGVEIPLRTFGSGFLDKGIDNFHRAFGIESGKAGESANRFFFEAKKDGQTAVRGESGGIGPGDIRVTVKRSLFSSGGFAAALMADVELPTGNAKKGYGNGSLDGKIAFLADWKAGDRIVIHANAGKVFAGDIRGYVRLPVDDYRYAALALEAALSARSSVVAQYYIQDTPLPQEGLIFPSLRKKPALASLGYRYASERYLYEFSVTENIKPAFAPDLMLNLTIRRNLSR
ncbi:MAG: DUF3187 family protein [Deltaproteobacteria bacterium]|nr:DUF3187 family protein [Deltaproteobacteria bacterium]